MDALADLMNVCMGRAADSLNLIMNQRVFWTIPDISDENCMPMPLPSTSADGQHTLALAFKGNLSGEIYLTISGQDARIIACALSGITEAEMDESMALESMSESLNILGNAVIGTMSNMTKLSTSIGIPRHAGHNISSFEEVATIKVSASVRSLVSVPSTSVLVDFVLLIDEKNANIGQCVPGHAPL